MANTTSHRARGCQISQAQCVNHPTYVGLFGDTYAPAHADVASCMVRAEQYAVWCNNPAGEETTVTFYDGGRAVASATHTR